MGIAFLLSLEALVNVAVVAGAVPATGMALPFFSAGGSSLIATAISCGLLYNLSASRERLERLAGSALPAEGGRRCLTYAPGALRPFRRGAARSRARSKQRSRAIRAESQRVLALAFLVAAALVSPCRGRRPSLLPPLLRVTRYEISGNASMTREEVLSAALIHDKEYFFSLDVIPRRVGPRGRSPRGFGRGIQALPERPSHRRQGEEGGRDGPGSSSGDRTAAVCIDSEGVAFAEASAEEAAAVPVLSGIRFEGFRLGTRLPPRSSPIFCLPRRPIEASGARPALRLLRDPRVASHAASAGLGAASGAAADEDGAAGQAALELLLYPLNQRIPVRVGASLDAPTLRSIILVLDVLGTKGIAASVQEIDFRTGTVVYRSKEGQSG